jgi:predicted transcriptional regulator
MAAMNTIDERRQAANELRDLQEQYDDIVSQIREIAYRLKDNHAKAYVVEHMESLSETSNRYDYSLERWIADLEDPNEDE